MSQSSENPSGNCCAHRKCCKKGCLAVILAGLLLVVGLHVVHPPQYEATASIQIRATKVPFLSVNTVLDGYDQFVQTQFAYMRSPQVIDRVLEDPDVARLPIILKQKDRRGWLMRNLRIKSDGNSEIVVISIRTDAADAAEKIVNAVVENYFQFIEELERSTNTTMLSQLQIEKRRQQVLATGLQENIRANTKKVAVKGESVQGDFNRNEMLLQEIAAAEVALIKMQAEHRAVMERIEQLNRVPLSILVQFDPEVVALNRQKDELWKQRKELRLDNPKGVEILHQIKELEDKIGEIADADDGTMKLMQNHLLAAEGMDLYTLDQKIRAQEILVEELEKRYAEQQATRAEHSEGTVEVSFEMTQLARVNKTIDALDDRVLAIQTSVKDSNNQALLLRILEKLERIEARLTALEAGQK